MIHKIIKNQVKPTIRDRQSKIIDKKEMTSNTQNRSFTYSQISWRKVSKSKTSRQIELQQWK